MKSRRRFIGTVASGVPATAKASPQVVGANDQDSLSTLVGILSDAGAGGTVGAGTVLGLIVLNASTVSDLGLVASTALGAAAGIAIGMWRRRMPKKHTS